MERNQNGYPVRNAAQRMDEDLSRMRDGLVEDSSACIDSMPLAYAYVPMQSFRMLYDPAKALCRGTLFEELDLPLGVYNNGK